MNLARYIDHTLLKPDATAADIDKLCAEAKQHGFASVCINPFWVSRAARTPQGHRRRGRLGRRLPVRRHHLRDQGPRDAPGHPGRRPRDRHGDQHRGAQVRPARTRPRATSRWSSDACHESGALNKVIIEAALLTDAEKVIACRLAKDAKADFVKTSTGYASGGATVFDVALMREAVGPRIGVKAAGGIRTRNDVEEMIAAGATRIGASAGVKIVTGAGETSWPVLTFARTSSWTASRRSTPRSSARWRRASCRCPATPRSTSRSRPASRSTG